MKIEKVDKSQLKDNGIESDLVEALRKIRHIFVTLGLFSFFINVLMLAAPIYMLAVYDLVMPSKSVDSLLFITIVIVAMFIAMGILEHVRSQVMIRMGNKLEMMLDRRIFDASFDHASSQPGQASSEPFRDLNAIKAFLSGPASIAFFDAPWFPIYIAIMFMFDSVLGWYGVTATLIIVTLTIVNERLTKSGLEKAGKLQQASLIQLNGALRNAEVVEAMGMRETLYKRWRKKYHDYLLVHTGTSEKVSLFTNTSKTFRLMASSMMYGVGALLAIAGAISPGMIIAGAVLMGRALQPIAQLVASWKTFGNAREAYARLNKLLEHFPHPEEPQELPEVKGNLSFDKVVVIPPGASQPVLKGVSFQVQAGECVGIIGPSAAGKSTLVKTAVGFWAAVSGDVRIDGAKLEYYDVKLRGQILGYLPQDVELFEGTIAENISRFMENEDSSKVLQAAQLAGVHDLILQLENGYNTHVGTGGVSLSGGQRQRIGLARAIYGLPKIVILDEPNSNLDDAGEMALQQAIVKLKELGITVVFITHTKTILGLADKIMVIQNGELAMFGSRAKVFEALNNRTAQVQQSKGDSHA